MAANVYIETLPSGFTFDMILVEGGAFLMGGGDPGAFKFEKPIHAVRVSAFYLGQYPVTQALWKTVMGKENNPSNFKGDSRPVETVSWLDAQNFIYELNAVTQENRRTQGLGLFRLPSEAEWEFAARGGMRMEGYLYAGSDKLTEVGWCQENSNNQTHDVGLLMANELGFYDLSGNVWEWVEDPWHGDYKGAPAHGSAWENLERGADRVRRGGSYFNSAQDCRSTYRNPYAPGYRFDDFGFRLALSPSATDQPAEVNA